MASDNGKAGQIDWYDVWSAAEYLERKYNGTVEINLSSALETSRPNMLLCASFVGNDPVRRTRAAGSYVVPLKPGSMREVPGLAHELLLELQEEIDDLSPGYTVLLPPRTINS